MPNVFKDGEEYYEYEHVITGSQFGVIFEKRGEDDPHVCITLISEDDGTWHVGGAGEGFSSTWITDLAGVVKEAREWLDENCISSPDDFGWTFQEPAALLSPFALKVLKKLQHKLMDVPPEKRDALAKQINAAAEAFGDA